MADVQHYDFSFEVKDVEKSTKEVVKLIKPKWDAQSMIVKRFTEGLCNVMVGCHQELDTDLDEMLLVRVFGANTDVTVDRQAEKDAILFLSNAGFAPPVYCTFNNGMVYGYIKGSTLDQDMVRDEHIRGLIAKKLARMHCLDKSTSKNRQGFSTKLETWLSSVPEKFRNEESQQMFETELGSRARLVSEAAILCGHLEKLTCDVVLCHNDLLLNNIVYNSNTDEVGFIDYEFAFYNYQAFDIGNHFAEYNGMDHVTDYSKYPSKEYQLSWIRVYLEEYHKLRGRDTPSEEQVDTLYREVRICILAVHFFWAVCGLFQVEYSEVEFEWMRYTITRMKEYYRLKKEMYG